MVVKRETHGTMYIGEELRTALSRVHFSADRVFSYRKPGHSEARIGHTFVECYTHLGRYEKFGPYGSREYIAGRMHRLGLQYYEKKCMRDGRPAYRIILAEEKVDILDVLRIFREYVPKPTVFYCTFKQCNLSRDGTLELHISKRYSHINTLTHRRAVLGTAREVEIFARMPTDVQYLLFEFIFCKTLRPKTSKRKIYQIFFGNGVQSKRRKVTKEVTQGDAMDTTP